MELSRNGTLIGFSSIYFCNPALRVTDVHRWCFWTSTRSSRSSLSSSLSSFLSSLVSLVFLLLLLLIPFHLSFVLSRFPFVSLLSSPFLPLSRPLPIRRLTTIG